MIFALRFECLMDSEVFPLHVPGVLEDRQNSEMWFNQVAALLTQLSRELCSNNSCSVNSQPSSPSYIYLKASLIALEIVLCWLVSRYLRRRFSSWEWLA